jgi:hypothetical protein
MGEHATPINARIRIIWGSEFKEGMAEDMMGKLKADPEVMRIEGLRAAFFPDAGKTEITAGLALERDARHFSDYGWSGAEKAVVVSDRNSDPMETGKAAVAVEFSRGVTETSMMPARSEGGMSDIVARAAAQGSETAREVSLERRPESIFSALLISEKGIDADKASEGLRALGRGAKVTVRFDEEVAAVSWESEGGSSSEFFDACRAAARETGAEAFAYVRLPHEGESAACIKPNGAEMIYRSEGCPESGMSAVPTTAGLSFGRARMFETAEPKLAAEAMRNEIEDACVCQERGERPAEGYSDALESVVPTSEPVERKDDKDPDGLEPIERERTRDD